MKALVLEDNRSLAESLKVILAKQGWDVKISLNWKNVSSSVKLNEFELIVLDILLPDKKGFEILEILSQNSVFPKVAVISGFATKESVFNHVPSQHQDKVKFFKKPIDIDAFSEFVSPKACSSEFTNISMNSFFENSQPHQALNFYFPENQVYDSKQLIPLVFYAHLKSFTGSLVLEIKSQSSTIQFYKGQITTVVSSSEKSFFGEILVEHGLSLKEDIEAILNDKSSNKRIGERLLEKGLLSSHMLNFVLKEQIKIRLSEFMSYPEFKLSILEKPEFSVEDIEIDFNEIDFIDWLADSVQTELNADFLEKLYAQIQFLKFVKISKLNVLSVYQRKFVSEYNQFFMSLKEESQISEMAKDFDKDRLTSFLYFGLLTKSIYLKPRKSSDKIFKKIESFLDDFLSKSQEELSKALNNSPTFNLQQIKMRYKDIVKSIHPDLLPENTSKDIKHKAEEAVKRILFIYKKIVTENQPEGLEQKQKSNLFTVIESYQEGLIKMQEQKYRQAYDIFLEIKDEKQAPSNTTLYLMWADLEKAPIDLKNKDRQKAVRLTRQIDSCPIYLRTSYLFWFVKGLLCFQCNKLENAKDFFEKTLSVKKDFSSAKLKLLQVKQLVKKQNMKQQKNFFSIFKRSS